MLMPGNHYCCAEEDSNETFSCNENTRLIQAVIARLQENLIPVKIFTWREMQCVPQNIIYCTFIILLVRNKPNHRLQKYITKVF